MQELWQRFNSETITLILLNDRKINEHIGSEEYSCDIKNKSLCHHIDVLRCIFLALFEIETKVNSRGQTIRATLLFRRTGKNTTILNERCFIEETSSKNTIGTKTLFNGKKTKT